MEITNVSVPTPAAASTSSGSTGAASGKAGGSGELDFSVIMANQQAVDDSAEGTTTDTQLSSLMGLLQMLQQLIAPLRGSAAVSSKNDGQDEQSLPELLVQALNKNSELTDALLKDPEMQNWLAQAAALIPVLSQSSQTSVTGAAQVASGIQPAQDQLSAQETLLHFAALVGQSPNNPIVRHLMNELRQTVEPLLSAVAGQEAPAVAEEVTVQALETQVRKGEAGGMRSGTGIDSLKLSGNETFSVDAAQASDSAIQQTKSKLEVLAARSSAVAAVVQQIQTGQGAKESGSEAGGQDSMASQTPVVPLQDLLKTIQQAEAAPKMAQATIPAHTFVRDMSGFMVSNMKLSMNEMMKEARLILHPEHLGQVDVKITLQSNGQLVAQFMADNAAGRQLLESQLPQLRQALQNQGLQVERLEVSQQAAASGMFQQSHQQGGNGQPFARNQRERVNETDTVDGELTNDLRTLAEHRQEKLKSSGSSFDETA
ncbi:flagellar hook-length control protein FliK [Paenibacillus chartarius]|uniref:Flagellar hook-length control protein FliK n=1 Tax=Paenibacillus chartarius TaxID=747481 RepID=A0ABV6DNX2_9BACL